MQTRGKDFLCLQCGFLDFGHYCSRCGASLKVGREQLPDLLARWLKLVGYQDLAPAVRDGGKEGQESPTHPRAISAVAAALTPASRVCGRVLGLDRTNIKQFEILVVIDGTIQSEEAVVASLGSIAADVLAASPAGGGLAGMGIKVVTVRAFVICEGGEREVVERLKAAQLGTPTTRPKVKVSVVGVGNAEFTVYPKWFSSLDPEERQIFRCIRRQMNVEQTLSSADQHVTVMGVFFHEVLGRPTEGIQELGWVIYSILTKPMYYAAQIEEERITLPVALSYLGMLAVVLAIIEGIAGLHEMTIVDMPVLDEVLTFLLLVVLQVAVALILWMGLRAVGGKGTYKKTLIAQITLTVALLPLTTMVDACAFTANHQIYQEMTISPGSRMMNGLNGLYVLPVLSVVHRISRTRVFFGSLVGVLGGGLAVLVVLFFMGLFSSS
jgi:hypothetical protein